MRNHKNLVIVRSILDQGLTVSEAAEKFAVSRQWIYVLKDRYQQYGPEGLQPRSTAPHTTPHAITAAVRKRIIELRDELTTSGSDNGAETIAWHLQQQGLHTPSKSTIHRILKDAGRVQPQPRKRPKSSYHHFTAALPNELWQTDITHTYLTGSRRADILDFLDDHSRYLLAIQAFMPCTGADVAAVMTNLITTYGAPAATLSDNGLVFTSRYTSRPGARNAFETVLTTHHIQQKNGRPGHPQTQGKIERFHSTLKQKLARAFPQATTITELQEQLNTIQTWYNNHRPHRALNHQTPRQANERRPQPRPPPRPAYERLPKASPHHVPDPEYRTRNDIIDNDGKVTLRYAGKLRHLGMGRAHRRRPILMLIEGPHVTTLDAHTGEIIAYHHIDPTKNYQPKIKDPT